MIPEAKHAQSGARSADFSFDSLYEAYAPRILALAYRMTFNRQTAEDLTQEIFIKIYRKLPEFRGEAHVYTWMYRIAVNHILNYLKKQKRERWIRLLELPLREAFKEGQPIGLQVADDTPSAQQQLETRELQHLVRQEILKLPPKYRVPFVLHRYEKMSHKEIGEILNISISAVETRIHRATKQLVNALRKKLEE